MKIPFDIKYRPQIESGEYKVETREGDPVRIICWDRRGTAYPIIGLITQGDWESAELYNALGDYLFSCDSDFKRSLVVVAHEPDPELTEFEKAVGKVLFDWQGVEPENRVMTDSVEVAVKQEAAYLLKIAREQIKSEEK